ncbi:hypothetical protein KEM56_005264, partial [Ascosphaera pollenicola]
ILGIDTGALELQFLSSFPVEAERFKLRQRALHCFKEARRVLEFKSCLTRSDKLTSKDVEYLGHLLDESQASCRELYNCSCDEVNDICLIARKAGAVGSRVTGAGWGGGTISQIPWNEHAVTAQDVQVAEGLRAQDVLQGGACSTAADHREEDAIETSWTRQSSSAIQRPQPVLGPLSTLGQPAQFVAGVVEIATGGKKQWEQGMGSASTAEEGEGETGHEDAVEEAARVAEDN